MDKENYWSEINKDVADIAKRVKSKIDEEDLVEDLKDTFKITIDNTSQLINNIIKTVESTVTDEDIKNETKEIVNNINSDLKALLYETKNKISDTLNMDSFSEEE